MKKALSFVAGLAVLACVLFVPGTHARVQSSYAIFFGTCGGGTDGVHIAWLVGAPNCSDTGGYSTSLANAVGVPMPSPGTLSNLTVATRSSNDPAITATVYVNGSSTSLTCSIAVDTTTSCTDSTDIVQVNTGDFVLLGVSGGSGVGLVGSFEKQ